MGLFDSMCCESGLIIKGDQRLILIAEVPAVKAKATEVWMPIALPIAGTNDRGGTMDVPKKLDANMKAVVAFGKTLAFEDEDVKASKVGLEALLDELRGDGSGATSKERRVSFALIAGEVWSAIVKAVAANGATAWTRYAQLGLGVREPLLPNRKKLSTVTPPALDATTKRLCEAILAAPGDEGLRKVYVDHLLERGEQRGRMLSLLPALGKLSFEVLAELALPSTRVPYPKADHAALKPSLVELVRFLAWGTTLAPAYGEGQFTGYDGDFGVAAYVTRARKKYADMPELVAAVAANEQGWRERGADDDDDDDDD